MAHREIGNRILGISYTKFDDSNVAVLNFFLIKFCIINSWKYAVRTEILVTLNVGLILETKLAFAVN